MKERPILFSSGMVQAILEGRKTQTRRVIKPQPNSKQIQGNGGRAYTTDHIPVHGIQSPYGEPGDLLWVRETFRWFDALLETDMEGVYSVWQYKASTEEPEDYTWKPSIHMPKEASRIWLRVKDVRVERVQDITSRGALMEGYPVSSINDLYDKDVLEGIKELPEDKRTMALRLTPTKKHNSLTPKDWFSELWDSINAKRGFGWKENPWVWCVSFEVLSTIGKPEGL